MGFKDSNGISLDGDWMSGKNNWEFIGNEHERNRDLVFETYVFNGISWGGNRDIHDNKLTSVT